MSQWYERNPGRRPPFEDAILSDDSTADGFIVQGLPGLWPRFGLYEDGELLRVFWGWTAVHANVRAIRYARGLEQGL